MKHPEPDPAPRDEMTEDQAETLLAEALEDYHRTRARGERPDDDAYRERLGDLHEEFQELVAHRAMWSRVMVSELEQLRASVEETLELLGGGDGGAR